MTRERQVLNLIIANIRNKPGRNIATVFCFAFIAANVFSAQYFIAGTVGSMDQTISRMGADLIVAPIDYSAILSDSGSGNMGSGGQNSDSGGKNTVAIITVQPSIFRFRCTTMEIFRSVAGVAKMSPQIYVGSKSIPSISSAPVSIIGIDPETDFTITPWLSRPLLHPLQAGEMIVGSGITGEGGSPVLISGHTYTIAGRLDPTRSPIDNSVFLPLPDAYALGGTRISEDPAAPRIFPGDISAILVKVMPGSDPDNVSARIKQTSPGIVVISRHFALDPVSQDVKGIPNLLNAISAIVVLASLPLIALISAMVAHERQREIGLLKSMGAGRRFICTIVIGESLTLSVVGGIAGICMSLAAFFLLNPQSLIGDALQVSFRMPDAAGIGIMAGTALLVVIAIGSITSLWPAYRSSMMNPYDAIRSAG
jgi:putative ABC transport system permease protein